MNTKNLKHDLYSHLECNSPLCRNFHSSPERRPGRAFVLICLSAFSLVGFFLNPASSSSGNPFCLSDSTHSTGSLNLVLGKKLYKSKCGKCHALYSPKDYKLKTWKQNLDQMKNKADLTANEYDLIFT